MISIDYGAQIIDRDDLSDSALLQALQELRKEDEELRQYGRIFTVKQKRVFRAGNISVTRDIYTLKEGWSFT